MATRHTARIGLRLRSRRVRLEPVAIFVVGNVFVLLRVMLSNRNFYSSILDFSVCVRRLTFRLSWKLFRIHLVLVRTETA